MKDYANDLRRDLEDRLAMLLETVRRLPARFHTSGALVADFDPDQVALRRSGPTFSSS
jgi:hypothetical protein